MESKIEFKNNKLYHQNYNESFSSGSYIDFNKVKIEDIKNLINELQQLIERRENE